MKRLALPIILCMFAACGGDEKEEKGGIDLVACEEIFQECISKIQYADGQWEWVYNNTVCEYGWRTCARGIPYDGPTCEEVNDVCQTDASYASSWFLAIIKFTECRKGFEDCLVGTGTSTVGL